MNTHALLKCQIRWSEVSIDSQHQKHLKLFVAKSISS